MPIPPFVSDGTPRGTHGVPAGYLGAPTGGTHGGTLSVGKAAKPHMHGEPYIYTDDVHTT